MDQALVIRIRQNLTDMKKQLELLRADLDMHRAAGIDVTEAEKAYYENKQRWERMVSVYGAN